MCKVTSAVQFYHVNERAQSWKDQAGCKFYVAVKQAELLQHQSLTEINSKEIIIKGEKRLNPRKMQAPKREKIHKAWSCHNIQVVA